MKFPALLYFAANLMAQTALDVPWLGASRDSSGRIRNIYGVSGNFLAGEPAGEPVQSAAFSRQSSLIKTANGVQVRRKDGMLLAERPAEDGPALFAFDALGAPALVYLLNSHTFLQWDGKQFTEIETLLDGDVRSIAVSSSGDWSAAVRRNGRLFRLTAAGIAEAFANDVTDVVLLPGGRALLIAGLELRLGSTTFSLNESTSAIEIEWMSDDWLQLTVGAHQYALRIKPGSEAMFRLPEVR